MSARTVSLSSIARRAPARVGVTIALVLVEAATELLFPLFIGRAVDGLIDGDRAGLVQLGLLAVGALIVGAARRLYDTRTYAALYELIAAERVERERERGADVSSIAARSTLLNEFVEFLENSMPEIVSGAIGIGGTLLILSRIDGGVALAAAGLAVLVGLTYTATGQWNVRLHAGYNDELERQVDAIASGDQATVRGHFGRLMTWNRRLSDLETLNFTIVYLGVVALLVYSPIVLVDGSDIEYGAVLSALMYVLQYVEAVVMLPLFVQQAIRLREISNRLSSPVSTVGGPPLNT